MFKKLMIATVATIALALPAAAQMRCGDRDVVVDQLTNKYGESRAGVGISNGSAVMEVWRNEESGSWTLVVNLPDGRSCIAGVGENWQTLNEEPPVQGDPS